MCIVCVAKKPYINKQRIYLFRLLRTCSHLNTSKIQMYNKKYISNTRKCIKYNLFNAKNCGIWYVALSVVYVYTSRSIDRWIGRPWPGCPYPNISPPSVCLLGSSRRTPWLRLRSSGTKQKLSDENLIRFPYKSGTQNMYYNYLFLFSKCMC